ncbi:MAG TPA: nicotinate phosphoribosyltransferase, partial [Acidobacteriota bacterium]|nr:nicotinate phosphoribosyltransferase [Acidobacteriota bacterium]
MKMLQPLFLQQEGMALLTDLYQLTMAAAYFESRRNEPAVFELSFRRMPLNRSFLVAAGLEQALYYITSLRFTAEDIAYLRSLEPFRNIDSAFFDYLADFRFTGDVWAVPEGTPVFPAEPVLQVRAPLIEAQVLETYLLAVLNTQTMVATKGARIVRAARGRGVVDFGTRRAHGPQAGLYAARAAYIGGCMGTSNVLAGKQLGIPLYGTAAHSFVMAFPSELEAFRLYYQVFPQSTVLLIDTYDTLEAAKKVKDVGPDVRGVRIDSGNLLDLSVKVRRILDGTGMQHVKIFLSGDLNEYKIEELLEQGAPADFFGVGTELVTSYDDPALSGVYKLVEASDRPVMKISPGKISYPGRKQVYRFERGGLFDSDRI